MDVSQEALPPHFTLSFPPAPSAQSRARKATMASLYCEGVWLTAQRRPAAPPTGEASQAPGRDSAGSRGQSREISFQPMLVRDCVGRS